MVFGLDCNRTPHSVHRYGSCEVRAPSMTVNRLEELTSETGFASDGGPGSSRRAAAGLLGTLHAQVKAGGRPISATWLFL